MYSSVYFQKSNSTIHWWEYDNEGEKRHYKEAAPLYFYMQHPEGEYTSIYGDKLRKVEFDTIGKFIDTKKMYKDAGRKLFESDISQNNRFILDHWAGQELIPPKFDVHFIDIEVHSETGFPKAEEAEHPIVIITVWSTKRQKYYIFAANDFNTDFLKDKNGEMNHYVKSFKTEKELLATFVKFINQIHPDIVSGWNSSSYDIPYIINRCNKILGERQTSKLSPIGIIKKHISRTKFSNKEVERFEIAGINCIDYLELYKKYHPNQQESYRLDYIARLEINESKIHYEGSLKELYNKDWQKYVEYNVQDVNLLIKLDEKLQFMSIMTTICYGCRVPFEQFAVTTKILDGAFISKLLLDKIVLPDVAGSEKNDKFTGAYVHDPQTGVHEWLMSYDATSLYPSIMIQHNISPETKISKVTEQEAIIILDMLEDFEKNKHRDIETEDGSTCIEWVNKIKEHKLSIASNGAIYRHDKQGVVPKFVEEWFQKRNYHKNLMKDAKKSGNHDEEKIQNGLQYNFKILINSVFGFFGTEWSRLYDQDSAAAITLTGQEIIKNTSHAINSYFEKWEDTNIGKKLKAKNISNIITYNDTDSNVFSDIVVMKNGKKKTFREFFEQEAIQNDNLIKVHHDGRAFIFCNNTELPFYDEENKKINFGKVQYIERHFVQKPIFKIKTKSGKHVSVTEDHSCMVIDSNGKLVEKKPKEIIRGDKIISLKYKQHNIYVDCELQNNELQLDYEVDEVESVEYINSDYQDVYDIGMVDTPHTYFANDILLHNSCYLAAGRILKSINYDDTDIQKTVKFLDEKISPLITKIIDTRMEHLAKVRMNCPENRISFKREMISRRGLHLAKKRYVAYVLNMEGKDIPEGDEHELEVKGVEIVRSSTPEIVRNALKSVVTILMKTLDKEKVKNEILKYYTEFMKSTPVSISKVSTANNLEKYTDSLTGYPIKGCPQHIKGAIIYNKLIKEMKLEDKYELIYEGDKVRVVYIHEQDHFRNNAISFKEKIPSEFGLEDCIDYDTMWEKIFMKPLHQFFQVLRWEIPNCEIEDIEDLFA